MNCRKCGGLMVAEKFSFTSIESSPWNYAGVRCLCCGRVEDPVILEHQARRGPQESMRLDSLRRSAAASARMAG